MSPSLQSGFGSDVGASGRGQMVTCANRDLPNRPLQIAKLSSVAPLPSSVADRRSLVNREECSARIHLADEYCRLVTEFNTLLDALKAPSRKSNQDIWAAAEMARASSQKAWEALEKHIQEHRCIDLHWTPTSPPDVSATGQILALAAMAALDVILVANDDRQFVDVNEAAAAVLGLPRAEIIGRRIDEFFRQSSGEPIPKTW